MQAQMFSGLSAVESIGTLLSPLFSLGYSLTVGTYGEAMFLVMSLLTGISALIFLYIHVMNLIKGPIEIVSEDNDNEQTLSNDKILQKTLLPSRVSSRVISTASNNPYGDRRQQSVSMAF
jgi:hypothetical protein